MFKKLIQALKPKKQTQDDRGIDKSKHRQHTTKYEDLCQ